MPNKKPCPHALHTMLGERTRSILPSVDVMTPDQARFALIECIRPAGHRGRHKSEAGKESWTGKLSPAELQFAEDLREVIAGRSPEVRHLVEQPHLGAQVMLTRPVSYLFERHDVVVGMTVGTVVQHSALGSEDTGVLVDWGDGLPVRSDLSELKYSRGGR